MYRHTRMPQVICSVQVISTNDLVWRLPRYKALGYRNYYIVITHRYAARDAQYHLFMLSSMDPIPFLEPLIWFDIALVHALIIIDNINTTGANNFCW